MIVYSGLATRQILKILLSHFKMKNLNTIYIFQREEAFQNFQEFTSKEVSSGVYKFTQ